MFSWLPIIALVFLFGAICLSTLKKSLFGIPNVFLEIIGLFMILFYLGLHGHFILFLISIAGGLMAAFFDPFIWKVLGYDFKSAKVFSLYLNFGLVLIMIIAFFLGYWCK